MTNRAQGTENREQGARKGSLFLLSCSLFPVFCSLCLPGCRSCDAVESELRRREAELRDVRDQLCQSQLLNDSLQRELHHLQEEHGPGPTEEIHLTSTVKNIVLGRQTGGYHEDRCPGDEALQVVLEPRDCDNHALKVPGTLRVAALEIGTDGLKKPLSTWEVSADQLRRYWKTGLWSNGYYVILPWQVRPTTEKLRVVAQFILADGRVFEADKDVTLHLAPVHPSDTLPPPRPLETKPGDGPELPTTSFKKTGAVQLGRPEKR